jgi:hypothetical protein
MVRGRKPIQINRQDLQDTITQVESEHTPKNRTELWILVENSNWAKRHNYKTAVLKKNADLYNIKILTPKGLRGNTENLRKSPTNRKRKLIVIENPEYYHNKYDKSLGTTCIDKFLSGSFKAAIKLNCYECSGYSKIAVSNCPITTCPMWNHRPWKKGPKDEDDSTNTNQNETT